MKKMNVRQWLQGLTAWQMWKCIYYIIKIGIIGYAVSTVIQTRTDVMELRKIVTTGSYGMRCINNSPTLSLCRFSRGRRTSGGKTNRNQIPIKIDSSIINELKIYSHSSFTFPRRHAKSYTNVVK